MLVEQWKDIKGYEGMYQVSTLGRVRSLDRMIYNKGLFNKDGWFLCKGRVLTPRVSKSRGLSIGYYSVCLIKNGVAKNFCIHRLVASAFLENPYNKDHVDHIDSDVTNNKVDNLRWCTQKENMNNINTRRKKAFLYNSELAIDVAKRNNISRCVYHGRLHNGWSIKDACTKPVRRRKHIS